jgi:hypothetical protein
MSWLRGLVLSAVGDAGDALDFILEEAVSGAGGAEGGEEQQPGVLQTLSRTMSSFNRFMKSLQN